VVDADAALADGNEVPHRAGGSVVQADTHPVKGNGEQTRPNRRSSVREPECVKAPSRAPGALA
jgi:hypothetical protein